MTDILIKPIITEKMTALGEKFNRFGFIVNRNANKLMIRKAVEEMYGVNVESVNTMIVRGKARQRFTKGGIIKGKTNTVKKAIVTLSQGETIDFYSHV